MYDYLYLTLIQNKLLKAIKTEISIGHMYTILTMTKNPPQQAHVTLACLHLAHAPTPVTLSRHHRLCMIFTVIGDCVMAPFPHRLTLLQEGGEGE